MFKRIFGQLKKKNKQFLPFAVGAFAILLPLAYFSFRSPQQTQAAWWNDVWTYRTPYTFTHNAALTDRRVEVTIDTATLITDGKMGSDCSDSRFTDNNGKLLDHDLTGTCNNGSTTYDVLFPTIINGDHIFYHYYGNPNANDESVDLSSYTSLSPSGGAPSASTEEVTEGPVAFWSFDEGYGTTAYNQIKSTYYSTTNTGAQSPTTISEDTSTGSISWFDYSNATSSDGSYAYFATNANAETYYLKATNFGFNIPENATIQGIEVEVEKYDGGYDFGALDAKARIVKSDGTIGTTDKADTLTNWPSSDAYTSYGGSSDLWGESWSVSDINDSDFGFAISSDHNGFSIVDFGAYIDHIRITVYYEAAGITGDATISGANWQDPSLCSINKCLYFDGADDVVTSLNSSNLDLNTGLSSNFTFSTWVRVNSAGESNVGEIFQKGTNTYCRTTNEASGAVDLECSLDLATSDATLTIVDGLSTNIWHHIALSYTDDGDDEITIYIDGQNRGSSTDGSGAPAADTNDLLIGGSTSANFHGYIDEFKVYPYARSAAQIKADYAARGSAEGAGAVFGTQDSSSFLSSGLVGYWPMDETSGNPSDSSGNGNTLTNVSSTAYSVAKYANGAEPDGTADYFDLVDNSTLSITGSLTLAAWIEPDDVTSHSDHIIGKFDDADESYQLIKVDDELRMYIDSSSNYETTDAANLAINTQYHVAGTYDSETQEVKLFVNGEQVASTTTGTIPSSIGDDAGEFSIGAEDTGGTPTNFFDGHIDEARIYNRALSPGEVRDLYEWAPGPILYYPLNEGSGTTTVNDISGNSYSGTLNGTMNESNWVKGKYGSALDLDGSDDYIDTNLTTHYDKMTFSSWIYLDSFGETSKGRVFDKRDAGSEVMVLYVKNDGAESRLQFYRVFDGDDGDWYTPNDSLAIGQWHHIALTYDSSSISNDPIIYIDGVPQTITEGIAPTGTATTNADPYIIGNRTAGDRSFDGRFDDVKIYNYIRTPAQIIEDMNAGNPVGGVGSQVAYWNFDESYGDTANDSVGSNNADLAGSGTSCPGSATCPEWVDGKIGRALYFDGTNADYADVGNGFTLAGETQVTITSWYKPAGVGTAAKPIFAEATSSGGFSRILFAVDTAGFPVVYIRDTSEDPTGSATTLLTGKTALSDDVWYHLAAIYNADTDEHQLYIDGKLDSTSNTSVTALGTSTTAGVEIGHLNGATNKQFGTIDELKIYKYALTQDQVLLDMNVGSGTALGGVLGTPEKDTTIDGASNAPVLRWTLDEKEGTTVYDKSGNGNDGSFNDTPIWQNASKCHSGSCLEFDTTDGQRITTSDDASISGLAAITLSAWVYTDTWTQTGDSNCSPAFGNECYQTIAGKSNWSDNKEYRIRYETNGTDHLSWQVSSDGSATTAVDVDISSYPAGNWYHLAGTWDTTTSDVIFYINGQEVGTSGTLSASNLFDGSANFAIAGSSDNGTITTSDEFPSSIDEVRVYDYAMTPAQIAYLYNRGAPVGWWKFDECQGTTAYDASGNGNDGTITIGTSGTNTSPGTCSSGTGTDSWDNGTSGKFNSAFDADGNDDYLTLSHTSDLNIGNTSSSFSVSYWLKTTSTAARHFISKFESGASNYPFAFQANNPTTGKMRLKIWDGSTISEVVSTSDINDGSWHHIVGVRDTDSDVLRIYIDGELEEESTDTTTLTTANTSDILLFRDEISGGGPYTSYAGTLDDFRIYKYSLSESQIKNIMNEGSAIRFGQ